MSNMMQPKKNPDKVWIGVAIGIAVFWLLCIFGIGAVVLAIAISGYSDEKETEMWEENYDYYDDYNFYDDDFYDYDDHEDYEYFEDYSEVNSDYYEFDNAIRTDLDYSVSVAYEENEINSDYSVHYGMVEITGVPNEDKINAALSNEIVRVKRSFSQTYLEQEYAGIYSTADPYITYMDENICSVIFVVYEYLMDGSDSVANVNSWIACVNIDVKNGKVLKNTEMYDVDDAFAKEFRIRSHMQNGVAEVDNMSEQEILDYLTDEQSLIIFYTPLGIEIGIGFAGEDGMGNWVTVTYKEESI